MTSSSSLLKSRRIQPTKQPGPGAIQRCALGKQSHLESWRCTVWRFSRTGGTSPLTRAPASKPPKPFPTLQGPETTRRNDNRRRWKSVLRLRRHWSTRTGSAPSPSPYVFLKIRLCVVCRCPGLEDLTGTPVSFVSGSRSEDVRRGRACCMNVFFERP